MLSDDEKDLLRQYDERLQMVRDRVRGVVIRRSAGFYLWGEGGISKSYTVLGELDRLGVPYRLTNSEMSPRGLFDLLAESPDLVHVFEDIEHLSRKPQAAGVLRSALWSTNGDRLITWRTARGSDEVIFSGAIVFIMNRGLDDIPALRALKTRIPHLQLQPSQPEIRAMMKEIATRGWKVGSDILTPSECLDVYEFVVAKCNASGKNYDLRMMVNGFADRMQWESGDSSSHWHDLIESRMQERIVTAKTRAGTIASEHEIALEIDALKVPFSEKVKIWNTRTGKAQAAFYRRLAGV